MATEQKNEGEQKKIRPQEKKVGIAPEAKEEELGASEPIEMIRGEEEHKMLREEGKKELEADLIRLQAEFENWRKRSAREMSERMDLGKMEILKSELTFIDEFEHALAHLKGEDLVGMKMVFGNFRKMLNDNGLREMEVLGQKYDPYKHEAILQQESNKEPGTILEVARKGYMFKDRVLRHAQVVIAKKKEEKSPSGGAPPKVLQPKQPPVNENSKKGE